MHNIIHIIINFTQVTDTVSKKKHTKYSVTTHQLAWEQQELDYNQMVDCSGTTQLDEFAETSLMKQLPRHKCRDAWQDVCQQQKYF